jgi:hypothetical protein
MPETIETLQRQLDEIMDNDSDPFIRIEDAAQLIGADPDCIRKAIYNGTCPFGIGYAGNKVRNGYSKIPKLPFYYWMTGQVGAGITFKKRNER